VKSTRQLRPGSKTQCRTSTATIRHPRQRP